MPSQRKRIGFLPSEEVQNIIDQFCKQNKLSQSKVTGILVEEALSFRGVLNSSFNNNTYEEKTRSKKLVLTINEYFNNKSHNDKNNLNLDESFIKNEVKMINDFIEFKIFKNIMNQKTLSNQ